jgi:sialic acid synthase SpsE
LTFIDTIYSAFGLPVGLSDHTESSLAAVIGVSKGVTWIEKHFTLDRSLPGFDHAYAMEPDDFAAYVKDIRASEAACQQKIDKIGEAESVVKSRARRSLYASRNLEAGEILGIDDVLIVRPENALAPNDLNKILGKQLARSVQQYEPLSLGCFLFE